MKNYKNIEKLQSKKNCVLKSQITKNDLTSHNNGLYPKHKKIELVHT
jgi:hypothetical protein